MMYDIDYSNYTNVFSNRSDEGIIKCQNGYEFEDSEVYSSVVIDVSSDYMIYISILKWIPCLKFILVCP